MAALKVLLQKLGLSLSSKDNQQTSKMSNFITVFDNRDINVYCAYEAQVATFVSSV